MRSDVRGHAEDGALVLVHHGDVRRALIRFRIQTIRAGLPAVLGRQREYLSPGERRRRKRRLAARRRQSAEGPER